MNLLMLAPTFYMLQVYDRVMSSHNEMTLVMLSIAVVLAFGFYSFLEYMRSLIVIRIGNRFDTRLNERIYAAAYHANLQQKGVNAGQALNDLTTLRQFLTGQTLFSVLDAPWFPINLAIIFLFNVKVGLFALIGAGLLVFLTYWSEKAGKAPLKLANDKSLNANAIATNTLRQAEVIEAMGMLDNLKLRWHKLHLQFLALQAFASERVARITALTKFVRGTWQSLILGLGAYLAINNEISPGMMMAGSILMGRVLSPIEGLIGAWKQLRRYS
jgi:ATP-binding cassette subfamily C exporter for protease/lipase